MNKPELQNRYQLFIGGQWRDASDGEFFSALPMEKSWLSVLRLPRKTWMMLSGKHGKHLKPGRRFLPVNALPF